MLGCHPGGGVPFGTPEVRTAWSRACSRRVHAAVGTLPLVPSAGHGAGLTQGRSQGCWGYAYQALADPPCLRRLGQLRQLPPLQELASAAEGFLGGLASSTDATTTMGGTGPCVLPPGGAQSLSWPMQGRRTSWGLMLPAGSAPQGKRRAATLSGWKPVGASAFQLWWPQAAAEP